MNGKRIGKCGKTSIHRAPRRNQRLIRFQHYGELDEIKAADPDQRARTRLGRDLLRVIKGISRLAKRHFAKHRRQIKLSAKWSIRAVRGFDVHRATQLLCWGCTFELFLL